VSSARTRSYTRGGQGRSFPVSTFAEWILDKLVSEQRNIIRDLLNELFMRRLMAIMSRSQEGNTQRCQA